MVSDHTAPAYIYIGGDECEYEFDIKTDIEELIDDLDILRDAKKYGWEGFDKIYRDK